MSAIQSRKSDHLELCATDAVSFRERGTLLDEVSLVHDALPDLAIDDLDLSVSLFGKRLRLPLVIAAMTGGTDEARDINRALATIAEEHGVGFGLGSQRAMQRDQAQLGTYLVRDVAKSTLVLGNIGVVQAGAMSSEEVRALAEDVGADALCVHLNPAMELIQNDGDRDFRGGTETLTRLVRDLSLPIVVKETGCGISPSVGKRLRAIGVNHIDVSGAGGTSWVGVEALRAERKHDHEAESIGRQFWEWGVPTAVAVAGNAPLGFSTIIATGGIANGVDAARAIALGAHAVGIARPFLQHIKNGGIEGGRRAIRAFDRELRTSMLLTGSRTLADLARAPRVLGRDLQNWMLQLASKT